MKRKLIYTLFAVVFIMVLCAAAQAQYPVVDPVKYSQPPAGCGGYDFASMIGEESGFVMLDDWVCPDGLPVTDIHWWGSFWQTPSGGPIIYSDFRPDADPIEDLSFSIAIFADIPAGESGTGFSMPDISEPLWSGIFDPEDVSICYAFTDIKIPGFVQETVYQYAVDLEVPFDQVEGDIYWLGIVALGEDDETQWGWHSSCGQTGDFAVQALYNGELGDFYIPCGGVDMAFELTTVPEPGSLMALGLGLSSLLGLAMRKRRA